MEENNQEFTKFMDRYKTIKKCIQSKFGQYLHNNNNNNTTNFLGMKKQTSFENVSRKWKKINRLIIM